MIIRISSSSWQQKNWIFNNFNSQRFLDDISLWLNKLQMKSIKTLMFEQIFKLYAYKNYNKNKFLKLIITVY